MIHLRAGQDSQDVGSAGLSLLHTMDSDDQVTGFDHAKFLAVGNGSHNDALRADHRLNLQNQQSKTRRYRAALGTTNHTLDLSSHSGGLSEDVDELRRSVLGNLQISISTAARYLSGSRTRAGQDNDELGMDINSSLDSRGSNRLRNTHLTIRQGQFTNSLGMRGGRPYHTLNCSSGFMMLSAVTQILLMILTASMG